MILALLVIVPAALGTAALGIGRVRAALSVLLSGAAVHASLTALLWAGVRPGARGPFLDLDAPGLLFLSITSVLFLVISVYTVPYLLHGTHDAQAGQRRFVPCLLWFLAAMTLVAVTRHLAVMWAAVEATTLASAPLVYFYRRKGALEAAWKYLLLCSVGIALALLGVFFLAIAASAVAGETPDLTVSALTRAAPGMARPWLRAAFVLALVGYGTKMGLAPLHAWLPDAHSQAPSPVSALLSGALLNCAFLAILRFFQVAVASGDFAFARDLLLALGFASVGLACVFMVGQRDYKRLFAYSSMENMGIAALGVGLGGGAVFGAMFHVVNHALCKAGLFCVAGNVLREFGSTRGADVRGLLRRLPLSGALLVALFFAIGAAPPFGPFWSELLIFLSAMRGGQAALGVILVILLVVAFLGMAGLLLPMAQGSEDGAAARREEALSTLPPLVLAASVLALGIYLPPALREVLRQSAADFGG